MQTIAQARFDSGAVVKLAEVRGSEHRFYTYTENTVTGKRTQTDHFENIREAILGFARRCAEELTEKARADARAS